MEDACITLEREFKKVCIDLEYASNCLEAEFKSKEKDFPNVVSLLKRIKAVEVLLESVRRKSDVLLSQRRVVAMRTAQTLIQNFNDLKALLAQCHCNDVDSNIDEAKIALENALHMSSPGVAETDKSVPQPTKGYTEQQTNENSNPSQSNTKECGLEDITLSSSEELHPVGVILPEDFEGVPPHVRGRCSLDDTQRLLNKLRDDFAKTVQGKRSKGTKKKTQLSTTAQKLDAAGYRVCGQTGQCMLKTLQRLGYIEVAKKGDIITLTEMGYRDILSKGKNKVNVLL